MLKCIDQLSIGSIHACAHTDDVLAQDGVCQACQRSFTAGHASRRLTLRGRPYKQLWQYGFRYGATLPMPDVCLHAGQCKLVLVPNLAIVSL